MAAPGQSPISRTVQVEINLDKSGNLMAKPDYFEVSKGNNEEVMWVCMQEHAHRRDGQPCFTVDFDKNGSPFYESQFSSDSPISGLVRRDVLPGPKRYNYTVRAGNKSLDPGGGVRP